MMARTSEEALRILSRRAKVAAMVLRGTTNQFEIAERLGLDRLKGQPTVSRDLAVIKAEWKASTIRDLDEAKGREIEKLEAVELEYWQAWERSRVERQSTRTKRRTGGDATSDEAEVKKEARDGDPRFLDGVLACIKKRCELLGLDAPKKFAPTDPTGTKEYGDADRLAAIARLHARLGSPAGATDSNGFHVSDN